MKWNKEDYIKCIDTEYSYKLAKSMEQFKSNKVLGYRCAGSQAEFETGQMLYEEMKRIGLKSVHKDEITLDSWEFEKAKLKYTDSNNKQHKFELGGYQTEFHTDGYKEYGVVYVGKGTEADYDNIDVTGKLVIADMNQRNEWWINYPVYQAYLKGAAALLAVQQFGYGQIDERALNAQDIAGPSYAPAFSIAKKNADKLKNELKKNPELKISLNAESTVKTDMKSYNIVGRIPGRDKSSMILLSAHYDSYFSGFQDDNAAVAMLFGIAKALMESGFKPEKDIVFCAFAAEEWGITNSKYDWSTGAYEQVFTVHPEWCKKTIANINFELPAHAHGQKDAIRSTFEYADFIKTFIADITVPQTVYPKGIRVKAPIQTWSDDFSIAISGIPSMVNDFSSGSFMETHYHSQFDNENYYQEEVYRFHHELYGMLAAAYDRLLLPPMDFGCLFKKLQKSIDERICSLAGVNLTEINQKLIKAVEESDVLYNNIKNINEAYGLLLDSGKRAEMNAMKEKYGPVSEYLYAAFKKAQDAFVRLNWHDEVVFPHEAVQDNLIYIEKAIAQLKAGDPIKALEKIYKIDNNRYAFLFGKDVFTYFTNYVLKQPAKRLKWGSGRIIHHANLYESVHGLKKSAVNFVGSGIKLKGAFKEDIKYYKSVKEEQLGCLKDDMGYMSVSVDKMSAWIRKGLECTKDYGEQ